LDRLSDVGAAAEWASWGFRLRRLWWRVGVHATYRSKADSGERGSHAGLQSFAHAEVIEAVLDAQVHGEVFGYHVEKARVARYGSDFGGSVPARQFQL
jgi:hypothetical protein